ncbi:hypothetical protein ACG5V6_19280 [Streptomyces chitinivorans]|uniref:ATP-binding protein n=1 Tax=Streptomyces chitinivorans TaxID=1257027 RepID=A0ABW7HWR1_9ACTN|nr:hypothetical protein [Streptomyces chitinivorans]MDH2407527.1 hypothetical protein [Streptomyces chitinivorans]
MADTAGIRLRRPGAGREPAAAALLGWLTDGQAPRLCLVTGPEGAGKSHLLAWLVQYGGTRSGEGGDRRLHAVAPLAGTGVRGASWLLADDLRVAARAPGELVEAVAADTRRTVLAVADLHAARRPEAVVEQVLLPLLRLPHVRLLAESRTGEPCTAALLDAVADPAVLDLAEERWTDRDGFARWAAGRHPDTDAAEAYPFPGRVLGNTAEEREPFRPPVLTPSSAVFADPHSVTAYLEDAELDGEHIGALGRAWLLAGQSLCREQAPSSRALVLLAALGGGADEIDETGEETRNELAALAAPEPWRLVRSLTRDDGGRGWPGPVTALAAGRAGHAGALLAADHLGDVRVLDPERRTVRGRLAAGETGTVPLGVLPPGGNGGRAGRVGAGAAGRRGGRAASRPAYPGPRRSGRRSLEGAAGRGLRSPRGRRRRSHHRRPATGRCRLRRRAGSPPRPRPEHCPLRTALPGAAPGPCHGTRGAPPRSGRAGTALLRRAGRARTGMGAGGGAHAVAGA